MVSDTLSHIDSPAAELEPAGRLRRARRRIAAVDGPAAPPPQDAPPDGLTARSRCPKGRAVSAGVPNPRPAAAVVALALVLALAACRSSEPPSGSARVPEPVDDGAALIADAPADPAAFLAWAEERLARFPAPVAAPAPAPIAPRSPVVHLVDALGGAAIESTWSERAETAPPLAAVGPVHSDAPGPTAATRVVEHRNLGRFVALRVGGFAVDAAEVGSIVLEARVPFGRHVELSWSPFGFARMPLPDNERVWTLRVATGGLADWKGTVRALDVRTDGVGEGAIEIRSLAFHGHRAAFPAPAAVAPVTLAGTQRPAIYLHAPGAVTFAPVTVPEDAVLRLGLGRLADGDAVPEVAIEVVADGETTRLLDRRLAGPGWEEVALPLARFAGRAATIVLRAAGAAPGTLAFFADPTVYQPVADPPLLVVYLIDTLSAEHVDLYGHDRPTMPTLGRLASTGAWFPHMYCNSPVTVASVPDLMLAVPTERHGVHSPSMRPPEALVPLPAALRAAGFATLAAVTNVNAGPRQGMDRGFATLVDRIAFAKETEADRTVPLPEVTAWIERHADRPAFVYVHTAEPHAPYLPPPGFAGTFDPDYAGDVDRRLMPASGLPVVRSMRDLEHVRAAYDEEVLYADARLGAFLAALDALGVRRRATILVTADHGEELFDHGEWGHGPSLYEEVLRVPLVLAGARIPPVGRIARPVQMYDVMPTILDLAGLEPPHAVEGESLLPLVRDPAAHAEVGTRPIVVSHHRYWGKGVLEYAVIDAGRWKLIVRFEPRPIASGQASSRFQLFDLEADPGERTNLVRERPEITRRLVGILLAYAQRQPPIGAAAEDATTLEYDPEQLEQLRALGYVE